MAKWEDESNADTIMRANEINANPKAKARAVGILKKRQAAIAKAIPKAKAKARPKRK